MANYGARNGEEQSGEKCPPGLHRAALVGMFDLGNQPGFTAEDSPQQKVALVWQVDRADSKGRPFTMLDTVASYLSGPTAKKKSKFAERVEALIARPLTEDDLRVGVDDSMLLGKSAQLFVAPPGEGGKWPKIVQVIGLLGNPPMGGLTLMGEGSMPKHVEAFVVKARGKAVGGWKAPAPTPPNKSAPAGAQGGALPSQDRPADGSDHPF